MKANWDTLDLERRRECWNQVDSIGSEPVARKRVGVRFPPPASSGHLETGMRGSSQNTPAPARDLVVRAARDQSIASTTYHASTCISSVSISGMVRSLVTPDRF